MKENIKLLIPFIRLVILIQSAKRDLLLICLRNYPVVTKHKLEENKTWMSH